MAVEGSVKINVDLATKQALAETQVLERSLKAVDINPALGKNVSAFTKSLADSRAKVEQARSEVDKLSKSEANGSDKLKSARRELAQAEAAQGRMIQQLKLSGSAWKSVGAEQEQAGLQTSGNVSKLRGLRTQLAANQAEIVRTGDQLRHLSQDESANGAEVENTKAKYQQLQAQQQALVVESGKLQHSVGGLTPAMAASADKALALSGRFKEAGENMQNLGRTATMGATLPIVTGFGLAYKAASDFQYQLQDIRKEVVAQGYSTQQVNQIMQQLSSQTLTWSKQFGVGTKEINDGMFELVSNGYNVKQAMGLMPGLLKTMTANSDKSGQSIKLTASMLEQFGQNVGSNSSVIHNGNRMMNEMTEATHKSAMSLNDLQEISGNAGAAMHAMGVKTNEFMAISGRLKSAGIDASSVGTGLSAMMTRLGTGTGAAAADLKKYNIAIYDSKGKMKDVFDIIGQMQNAYKGMNDQQRQKFMYDTIGQENMKVGMTLMDANMGRYKSLSDEIANSTGTVDKYNKTMRDTNQFSQQQFKASLQALEIEFGQKLLPTITPIIKELTEMMKRFGDLDGQTQQNIIHTALLVAAAGPALSLLGKGTSLAGLFINKNTRLLETLVRLTAGTKGVGGALEEGAVKAATTGTAIAGTTGKMGLFSTATRGVLSGLSALGPAAVASDAGIGTLALGAAPAALAIAGIGTAAYFVIKAEREHEAEIAKHKAKIDEFGMDISDATAKSLKGFNDLHAGAENDMTLLDTSVGDQSKKLSSDVVDKYSKMADMVVGKFQSMKKDTLDVLTSIGQQFGTEGGYWAKDVENDVKAKSNDAVSDVKAAKQTITDIYNQLGGDLSQANATQKAELDDAQSTIAKNATVFAKSYADQAAIYNRYANDHGEITRKMYKADQKASTDAYEKSMSSATKSFDGQRKKLKASYDQGEIDYEQYQSGITALEAEREANHAKAAIQYNNTEKAFVDKYNNTGHEMLRNKQTLSKAYAGVDQNGVQIYADALTGARVNREQWIANAKKDNEKYLEQQKKYHGSSAANLNDYLKSQEKAYEAMGMDSDQAKAQAERDMAELDAQTSKSAAKAAQNASATHDAYIKGLQSGTLGQPADVAKQWGLDITSATQKVDLGKYGSKSAQDFWNDFSSGSAVGYKEAQVYFQKIFDDWKTDGNTKMADLSKSDQATLLQGLESGMISIKQVGKQFGSSIVDLFPNDLSQVGQAEWSTLENGLQQGVLSSKQVLTKFGASALDIFPNDLSQLGKNDIKTLEQGLQSGTFNAALLQQKFGTQFDQIFDQTDVLNKASQKDITTMQVGLQSGVLDVNALQSKYKQQLDSIYNQDLSKVGADTIKTLGEGYKLGLPEATQQMDELEKIVGSKTKVNVAGHGKQTMDTLNKEYANGSVSSKEYFSDLAKFIHAKSNIELTPEGSHTIVTYNNGLYSMNGMVTSTVAGIRGNVEHNTIPTGLPFNSGQLMIMNYSNGASSKQGAVTGTVTGIKNSAEGATHVTGLPFMNGGFMMNNYANGASSKKDVVTGHVTGVKNSAEDALTPSGKPYSHGSKTSSNYGKGIADGSSSPLNASADIASGVEDNLNTGIDAVNNLSSATGGSSKASHSKHSKVTGHVSGYSTGTRGQLTRPEWAMVGDGGRHELIDYGDGRLELSPDTPTMRYLGAGTTVFNGQDTLKAMPALKAMGVPMYAGGTGGNIMDWFKNLFGDVFKFLEHPIENWSKLIDQTYDMKPFGADSSGIGGSTKSWEKKQTSFLTKMQQEISAIGTGQGHVSKDDFAKAAHMAAGLMNQTLSDHDIDHLYFQAMTESTANPSQGGGYDDHDGTGLPMGIFQYKRGTFSSWAVPGHTNILSLMDQLLAVLNDSNWRSDFPPIGVKRGWGPTGHKMFDKGGVSYEKQLAWVSEHGQKELHIPDDQSDYSKQLTEEAVKMSFGQQAYVATTAEQASGFRPSVMTAPQPVQSVPVGTQQQTSDSGIAAELKTFMELLSTKMVNINVQLDNGVLFSAQYPLIKLALGQDVTIDRARGGK